MRKAFFAIAAVGIIGSGSGLMMNANAQAPAATPPAAPAPAVKAPAAPVKPADPFAALPEVLAQVGDSKVTKADILKLFSEQAQMQQVDTSKLPPEMLSGMIYSMVNNKITMDLLNKAAEKDGFKASKEAALKALNDQLAEVKKQNPKQYEMIEAQIKQTQNSTLEQYVDKLASNPMFQSGVVLEQWLKSKIQVNDKDIEDFYNKNKETYFKTPADPADSVRISHILLKADGKDEKAMMADRENAEKILVQLKKDPTQFEKVAENSSACPSGKMSKGALGPQLKGQAIFGKEFEDAAFKLKVGEISGLVKSNAGYHILRRDASKAATQKQLTEPGVKESIQNALFQQKVGDLAKGMFDKAMKDGQVKMFIEAPKAPQFPGQR